MGGVEAEGRRVMLKGVRSPAGTAAARKLLKNSSFPVGSFALGVE
jgi:hypothetical protein